jgi:hypothetical protein
MIQIAELICLLVFFVLDLPCVKHVDEWVSTLQTRANMWSKCLYSESR